MDVLDYGTKNVDNLNYRYNGPLDATVMSLERVVTDRTERTLYIMATPLLRVAVNKTDRE